MSEENTPEEGTTAVDGVQQSAAVDHEAELAEYKAKYAKAEKLRKEHAARLQEFEKKTKSTAEQEENYKLLWQESQAKAAKVLEKAKKSDIQSALLMHIEKMGVTDPDQKKMALRLVDHSQIDWDEEDGVDVTSVQAALQMAKKEYPIPFKSVVNKRDAMLPATGTSSDKTITRTEYDKMMLEDPAAWQSKRKEGYRVVDSR